MCIKGSLDPNPLPHQFSTFNFLFPTVKQFVLIQVFDFMSLPPSHMLCHHPSSVHFLKVPLLQFCLLQLPSSPPITPLVIMANSCYDKLRLDLFLSPLRQVLDTPTVCVCVCAGETGASACVHIQCMFNSCLIEI